MAYQKAQRSITKTTITSKAKRATNSPEPQQMRKMYEGGDRAELVSKLTTRVPFQLRSQLKLVAAYPAFGYRTQTQMYSVCMLDFLRHRPWEPANGFKWRYSTRADALNPLYHVHLEPLEEHGAKLSGSALKARVLEVAEAAGVNQAAFTLTFLWWVALARHRIDDPSVMRPLEKAPGAQPENRPTPEQMVRMRAAYLDLSARLNIGMRDLAARIDVDPSTAYNMFETTMPRQDVYRSLHAVMTERLDGMRDITRRFRSAKSIDGQALAAIRDVLGLSQSALAPVIGYDGTGGKSLVSAIETGIAPLRPERVTMLPEMLRVRLIDAEEPQFWKDTFAFLAKVE